MSAPIEKHHLDNRNSPLSRSMTVSSERSQFLSAVSTFSARTQLEALNGLVLMIGGCAFDQKPTDSFLRLLEQDAVEMANAKSVHSEQRGDHV